MKLDLKELFKSDEAVDERMQNTLLKAMKEAYIQEFDYLKFKKSIENMIELGVERNTAIKSAFATASTLGVSKAKILKTADHYKAALDKERDSFALALKNKIAKDVDGKLVEAKKLTKEIQMHKAKIEQLEKEIAVYQNKIETVDEVVAKNKKKIDNTRNKFRTTFASIYSQIEEDIALINSLL